MVLWELLERKLPYADLSNYEVVDYVVNRKQNLPKPTANNLSNYPDSLWQLMLSCYERDPTLRPTFIQIGKQLNAIMKEAEEAERLRILQQQQHPNLPPRGGRRRELNNYPSLLPKQMMNWREAAEEHQQS